MYAWAAKNKYHLDFKHLTIVSQFETRGQTAVYLVVQSDIMAHVSEEYATGTHLTGKGDGIID